MKFNLMKPVLIAVTSLLFLKTSAQNTTIVQYINKYKHVAIAEMKRSGVPASIKLAQGILETQAGVSDLVMRSNNHFGIKCKSSWVGDKVYHDDDARGECFRSYTSDQDSYKDHSDFLKSNQRYAFLFKIDAEDYKGWAQGLKKAGYATNPRYWQMLVNYIETYNLNLYTQIALGKRSFGDEGEMYASVAPDPQIVHTAAYTTSAPVMMVKEEPVVIMPVVNYPSGEFRINNTKVIYAAAGTSLLALADQYRLKYKHIIDYNDLPDNEDVLTEGQLIYLQRKRKYGATDVVTAGNGESVYSIAQREGVRLENVLEYNHLNEDRELALGTRIYLQKKAAEQAEAMAPIAKTVTEQSTAKALLARHVVQPKETLFAIAKRYNVELSNIREWNNLQNDIIKIGQELVIYKN